jgi:uncharacterized protein (DUF1697 family)
METWVALLRGVNVGGITIKSADLRAVFTSLGYADVRTVLASGNVVFGASGRLTDLKTTIEGALRDRFGYDAWIVLVPHDRLAGILDAFPFDSAPERHDYVVFASDPAAVDAALDGLEPSPEEQVAPGDGVVYWSCPKGSTLHTAFAKRMAKASFGRTTTTRNANTLRKLL